MYALRFFWKYQKMITSRAARVKVKRQKVKGKSDSTKATLAQNKIKIEEQIQGIADKDSGNMLSVKGKTLFAFCLLPFAF
jgi:hypothetical protein